jgi:hypothetical protein
MNLLLTPSTGAPSAGRGSSAPPGLRKDRSSLSAWIAGRLRRAGRAARTGHGGAADGCQVDFEAGKAGGVEQAVGGGDGAIERIGLEQFLAQSFDQLVDSLPAFAERGGLGLDLLAQRRDVGPGFALRGGGTALVGCLDALLQKRDGVVAVVECCARRRKVAVAEDGAILGLFQLLFAAGSVV